MIVTLISQCEKRALPRTRRVLDAFANRIGDNVWQTVITHDGLHAVKKLLRKTASKNTAVACHYLKTRRRTELAWVVGNKDKFNEQGFVPANSTRVNRPHSDEQHDWHYLPVIQALTALAALLHDWGKANARFQKKLEKRYRGQQGDALRHEWISCLLLHRLISATDITTDDAWLKQLAEGEINEQALLNKNINTPHPLHKLPSTAQLLAWLIVSHHRLPKLHEEEAKNCYKNEPADTLTDLLSYVDKTWGYENIPAKHTLAQCLQFPEGLLTHSTRWLSQVKRWAGKLITLQPVINKMMDDGSYRLILHHARLSLMLGDHYYSSLKEDKSWKKSAISLLANTHKDKTPNQTLDQHLTGVCKSALSVIRHLPTFENEAPPSEDISKLKKTSDGAFAWQDKAVNAITKWKHSQGDNKHGFFAVNMASTGCGKTFANAKIMLALSKSNDRLRYILALGLRTLTLQTGDEYRERIFNKNNKDDLAVMIGSSAIKSLYDQKAEEAEDEQCITGSASEERLLDIHDEVDWDGVLPDKGLVTVLKTNKDKQLLYAPVLVCTIDHIMAATETTRGGRYILPCLRLMSSDLVIDEVDNFTGDDAIAIGRLIHLAGMLGRKVMISSATIPPALAEGYFNTYQEGWKLYSQTRNTSTDIGCAWIDEFHSVITTNRGEESNARIDQYHTAHATFVQKRIKALVQQPAKRKATFIDCSDILQQPALDEKHPRTEQKAHVLSNLQTRWFEKIRSDTVSKHQYHHTIDQTTGLAVSFGVIRTANIAPCVALARYLMNSNDWPENTEVRVMAYHSQQVLLLRNAQEKHLDNVLKRKEKNDDSPLAFSDTVIRNHLDILTCNTKIKHVLFILVATPVEEIGRDHDFDWAIIEPSSMASIIQLAGRVKRHRQGETTSANIGLLQYNWKTIKHGNQPYKTDFSRPGYEFDGMIIFNEKERKASCKTHDLKQLICETAIKQRLDAACRMQEVPPKGNGLARLEHCVIAHWLTNYNKKGAAFLQGYLTQHWYLTGLPQVFHRFRKSNGSIFLYLVEASPSYYVFAERDEKGKLIKDNVYGDVADQTESNAISFYTLTPTEKKRLWLHRSYEQLLEQQAAHEQISTYEASVRFGELTMQKFHENRPKHYNDQLGLFIEMVNDA